MIANYRWLLYRSTASHIKPTRTQLPTSPSAPLGFVEMLTFMIGVVAVDDVVPDPPALEPVDGAVPDTPALELVDFVVPDPLVDTLAVVGAGVLATNKEIQLYTRCSVTVERSKE